MILPKYEIGDEIPIKLTLKLDNVEVLSHVEEDSDEEPVMYHFTCDQLDDEFSFYPTEFEELRNPAAKVARLRKARAALDAEIKKLEEV